MKTLFNKNISDDEFERLMLEQSNGKKIIIENDKLKTISYSITEQDEALIKLNQLKSWFNYEYSKQEQKLRRLHTLNLMTDDNKSPLEELKKLYVDAEFKRKEIQRLEQILNNGGSDNGIIY